MINLVDLKRSMKESLDNALQNGYDELLDQTPEEVLMDLMAFDKTVEEADPIASYHPDDLLPEVLLTIKSWQSTRRKAEA